MYFNYRSFRDLSLTIRKNIGKLPANIDLVVGIPRSGIIPAYMIALFLNTRACSLEEFIAGIIPGNGERPIRQYENEQVSVLFVDDTVHSGISLEKTKAKLKTIDTSKYNIKFLAIYAREESIHFVDYYFEIVPTPRFFQWNYLNTNWVNKSCFDIDGVLCQDPTPEENDDGENYRCFLRNAKPLFIPTYKIYALVTSRLEKYREETEYWLKKHNVQYGKLIMLDLPSKEERIKQNAHAKFKAEIYKNEKETVLFVESDRRQAIEIAKATGKACICVATDELFDNRNIARYLPNEQKHKDYSKPENVRILLYSHELTYTGAPHSLLRIARILKQAKYQVEIWAPEDGNFREEIEKSEIVLRIVPYRSLASIKYQKIISSFDLALANTVISHRFYDVACKLIPTIWFIREAQNLPSICDSVPLRKQLLCTSPDLYCVSEYAKEFIQRNYNTKVKVLHNCVEDYFSDFTISPHAKISFISVGTVNRRKAFDICYKAFDMLPDHLKKQAHFYFVGRLNERDKDFWNELIKNINDNPNTTYLGEIANTNDKLKLFNEMDVFVVPSLDESCSLVVLEGAMMGKPLIVSENVGAKYLVDESNGWIVKTGNVESLSKVFTSILQDSTRLSSMGEASRKKYLETSTIEIYRNNILSMVKEKLKEWNCQVSLSKNNESYQFQVEQLRLDNQRLRQEIRLIHKSWTYRLGRFITFVPRKVRGGIRCYKENGWNYTIRRFKEKVIALSKKYRGGK